MENSIEKYSSPSIEVVETVVDSILCVSIIGEGFTEPEDFVW